MWVAEWEWSPPVVFWGPQRKEAIAARLHRGRGCVWTGPQRVSRSAVGGEGHSGQKAEYANTGATMGNLPSTEPRVDCGAGSCPRLTMRLCFAVQKQESWEPVFLTSSLSDACHVHSKCYGLRKSISEWMNFKKWTWPQASPFFSQDVHSLLQLKCWISMVVFKLSSRKKKTESPHQSPSKTEKSWGDWESRTLSPIHLSLD